MDRERKGSFFFKTSDEIPRHIVIRGSEDAHFHTYFYLEGVLTCQKFRDIKAQCKATKTICDQ